MRNVNWCQKFELNNKHVNGSDLETRRESPEGCAPRNIPMVNVHMRNVFNLYFWVKGTTPLRIGVSVL